MRCRCHRENKTQEITLLHDVNDVSVLNVRRSLLLGTHQPSELLMVNEYSLHVCIRVSLSMHVSLIMRACVCLFVRRTYWKFANCLVDAPVLRHHSAELDSCLRDELPQMQT